jgi:hypothetical protein
MERIGPPKSSLITSPTRRNIPEDTILQSRSLHPFTWRRKQMHSPKHCLLVIQNSRRWIKRRSPVSLSVILHRQNLIHMFHVTFVFNVHPTVNRQSVATLMCTSPACRTRRRLKRSFLWRNLSVACNFVIIPRVSSCLRERGVYYTWVPPPQISVANGRYATRSQRYLSLSLAV